MRRVFLTLIAIAGASAVATAALSAQQLKPAPPTAKPAQVAASPLTTSSMAYYTGVKQYLIASAKEMDEKGYAFKPLGTAAEVRTFGQILGHITDENYAFCAAAAGTKAPASDAEHTKKLKLELQKALAESFAYCDTVWAGTNDANAAASRPLPFNLGANTRLGALTFNTSHDAEHYGNIVTYLRAKGLVPPSSQPKK